MQNPGEGRPVEQFHFRPEQMRQNVSQIEHGQVVYVHCAALRVHPATRAAYLVGYAPTYTYDEVVGGEIVDPEEYFRILKVSDSLVVDASYTEPYEGEYD